MSDTDRHVDRTYHSPFGQPRRWRYPDDERPVGVCYDCGRPYDTFVDLVIPDEVWEKINPTYHEGAGLLCPNCMGDRLREVGKTDVSATIW